MYLQISHHWGFPPPPLIYAYLFIPSFFSRFHFGPDPASTSWHGCTGSSLVSQSACASWQSNHELWSQLNSLVSPCCKATLSDMCVCRVRGMSVCWPGRGPSARPLGKLACTVSGNFHYLPTGQNDFVIDRGFIMSAIPFFENMGKTEKEWWQGGGNSISS